MKNIVRWTVFTAALTLIWLGGSFCYLVLTRHYEALQVPALMLAMVVAMSTVSAVAAIAFAQKLDKEPLPLVPPRRRARF